MGYARCNTFGCECLGLTTTVDLKHADGQGSKGQPGVARQCHQCPPPSGRGSEQGKRPSRQRGILGCQSGLAMAYRAQTKRCMSRCEQAWQHVQARAGHGRHAQVFAAMSRHWHCARNWHRWAWAWVAQVGLPVGDRIAGVCCQPGLLGAFLVGSWYGASRRPVGRLFLAAGGGRAVGGRARGLWGRRACWAPLGKHRRLRRGGQLRVSAPPKRSTANTANPVRWNASRLTSRLSLNPSCHPSGGLAKTPAI
ncbi:hypothetical protein B0H67DRAFT_209564 [Lasiosphaeris hirsuta]|uniref:Uncharacterized protein n=1 Tax=Lasiosphaeris hirsuta TaxID=260670 RepID=A0AA40AS28_9PEZI|nr:hypothetical protein B0H67DRAFT_209564 [Lasiosphaeris hirsuta]